MSSIPSAFMALPILLVASCAASGPRNPSFPDKTETFTIDAVHSSVTFEIEHLGVSRVAGRFNTFSGTWTMNRGNPAKCALEITVEAASIDTNSADRDKHLRSAEFLDVENHPTITFKSTSFTIGPDEYVVRGDLTMLGVTRGVGVAAEYLGSREDARLGHRAGCRADVIIERSAFGMNTAAGSIGDDVHLTINIEGVARTP